MFWDIKWVVIGSSKSKKEIHYVEWRTENGKKGKKNTYYTTKNPQQNEA